MSYDNANILKEIRGKVYNKINTRESGFIECCKEYKFIKKAQTISFNNKMNELEITHLVLNDKFNQTDILIHDITIPVKFGAPIVIGIIGYTRSGKSEAAQVIFFLNKQANKKYKNRDTKVFTCWTEADLFMSLKLLKKGDIVWNDEQPKTIGTGRLKQKWAVNSALHAIAKMENCFIFVTPKFKDINSDICDLYLETAGQNRKTRINRFMILDDERRYFGHVYLKLHNDDKFRKWYEYEKDKFIDKIKKNPMVKAANLNVEEEEIKPILPNILPDMDNELVYKRLGEYDSGITTKRDREIFIRHSNGLIFEDLNEIYGMSNADYHYYKVLRFVKEDLNSEITDIN